MWESLQTFIAGHRVEIVLGTATSLLATAIAAGLGLPARIMNRLRSRAADRSASGAAVGTLAIVRDIYGVKSGWSPSTASDAKVMVSDSYLVTNRSSAPVIIAKVEARIGKIMEGAAIAQFVQQLSPGASAPFVVTFFATPRRLPAGKDLVVDLVFVDQLGNEHWLRNERFRFVPSLTTS
jgi:hypothetical protein